MLEYLLFCLTTAIYGVIRINYPVTKKIKTSFIESILLGLVLYSLLAPLVVIPFIFLREDIINEIVERRK